MDQIAASHITSADFFICGLAVVLYLRLGSLPPSSLMCRIVAALTGCTVAAIIVVMLVADNLSREGVFQLATIAGLLCFRLLKWNSERRESILASDMP